MLVATVIHTQEVGDQHVPFTAVHCEGEKAEYRVPKAHTSAPASL